MNKASDTFLSCDWGTSAFRLRLVETGALTTVAEVISNDGIANVFKQWQQNGLEDRISFYLTVVQKHISLLEQKAKFPVKNMPLIISGMASSTIGMVELDYKELPFSVDGSDLEVKKIEPRHDLPHDVFLISGVKSDSDAMRGEETQLVGYMSQAEGKTAEQIVLLPGTHSKHVVVKNGKAVEFKTYMTGEFFELLSQRSVLSVSVEKGGSFGSDANRRSFEKAVLDSRKFNLLHGSFRVRTNQLFNKLNKQENYHYLSGLLIGSELQGLAEKSTAPITLVGNDPLLSFYLQALKLLLPNRNIELENSDRAIVKGHSLIYRNIFNKKQ